MGVLNEGERITATDAAVMRAWLEDNHAAAGGLAAERVRRNASAVSYEDAERQALCFGWIGLTNIATARRPETRARRIATIVAIAAEGQRP